MAGDNFRGYLEAIIFSFHQVAPKIDWINSLQTGVFENDQILQDKVLCY